MNYIKPEDIKEYVSKNPEGIAGMSEELAVMVNHFAELIVRECVETLGTHEDYWTHEQCMTELKNHFGVKS